MKAVKMRLYVEACLLIASNVNARGSLLCYIYVPLYSLYSTRAHPRLETPKISSLRLYNTHPSHRRQTIPSLRFLADQISRALPAKPTKYAPSTLKALQGHHTLLAVGVLAQCPPIIKCAEDGERLSDSDAQLVFARGDERYADDGGGDSG